MNYPDEIPNVYQHFMSHYLPLIQEDEKLLAARKIREALTKKRGNRWGCEGGIFRFCRTVIVVK
jgi:hypothetical protein